MVTLPINHLKRTLDRCCGQWEFRYYDSDQWSSRFEVEFLNTHDYFVIYYEDGNREDGNWEANLTADGDEVQSPAAIRLTALLNGHKRNDAGDVELPSDFDCLPEVPQ